MRKLGVFNIQCGLAMAETRKEKHDGEMGRSGISINISINSLNRFRNEMELNGIIGIEFAQVHE